MKKKIGARTASLILVIFLVILVAVVVFGISTSGSPLLPFTITAGGATVLGLIFQALSDFIPRWLTEDARRERKEYVEPSWLENLRILGHALVIVGAAYFLATYLVPAA